jgi:hypothetical protein
MRYEDIKDGIYLHIRHQRDWWVFKVIDKTHKSICLYRIDTNQSGLITGSRITLPPHHYFFTGFGYFKCIIKEISEENIVPYLI